MNSKGKTGPLEVAQDYEDRIIAPAAILQSQYLEQGKILSLLPVIGVSISIIRWMP